MYFEDGITYSEQSPVNKEIIKTFLAREVKCDISEFVEYVIDTGTPKNAPPFTPDDIEAEGGIVCCPECGEPIYDSPFSISALNLMPEMNDDPECDPSEAYLCPVCGVGHPSFYEAKFCCEDAQVYQCASCDHIMLQEEYDELEECDTAAKEWWVVTPWLLKKLKKKGEIIIENCNIWGRLEDSVHAPMEKDETILEICRELGILDGQMHSWSKHVKVS